MSNPLHRTAPLLSALGLLSILASNGCTPNRPVMPEGPESTKTGYSHTYRINGRTDNGDLEAAGGIPSAGNVTFRAAPPKPVEAKESEEAEHKKD